MPFEKRSKSFRQATHDMLIKLKELRESFSNNRQEDCDVSKIARQSRGNVKTSIKRQKSSSLKDINSMSSLKEADCHSLKLESKTKSFNTIEPDVAAQIHTPHFAAQLSDSLKGSNLFNRQATLHNRRSLSVDHLSVSNIWKLNIGPCSVIAIDGAFHVEIYYFVNWNYTKKFALFYN
ncbi:hypothetical protein WA026_019843 [Henosepilachna vigintioctopunctata]|uniref:Uncharacterized protein n=1 Tax=Henosepilachna vigintioctopunctata TaxID=420089 RepID=A0AAW1V9M1_9CUCU